ncbi:nuclear transport factor 2 family protein [Hymenobacter sp. BT186]|uniref:Nuclear transport factor 2 family protein n=1 Tax=Hymenobacter telluris TaxID=2816474 RepID=A0A939J907_9BACT|nr:nuclear transport factor 2 family protein [Hymenobacter telluris]MBO0358314.1 nuclear transport factor 2 family protein [Hymenobacter telluris]MBW3374340.1 nuclear transport factor 2 family protein [Hymenobacter norwichensis]
MHPHDQLLHRFYQAFQRRDHAGMAACYHPEATFEDAIFRLQGPAIGKMWRMLCERGQDMRLAYNDIRADAQQGSATWDAHYTFSQTRRPVHNHVQARFTFQDGLIRTHHDEFSFWRWSRQALGPTGWLLGWSGWLQNKVRKSAAEGLANYRASSDKAAAGSGSARRLPVDRA